MRGKKGLCLALCVCALFSLARCSVSDMRGTNAMATPVLEQLVMPAYEEPAAPAAAATGPDAPMRVDLWLDASQVMGGVNEIKNSLYRRGGARYRQGGFHYRYGENTVGWYQDVLEALLSAAGDSRVRVLRAGNERLRYAFLREHGFDVTGDAARSLRRDLLTYAIDPMPDLFTDFSSDTMKDSFYSLGTPLLNQMSRFQADGGALLENPGKVAEMSAALDAQIAAFESKDPAEAAALSAVGDDQDSPLRYALENLDLSRLSIITCDPATLRRLSGTDTAGNPVDYIETLLRERGVFDQGLSVGLYALQLDYLGHMTSFCSADLGEAMIWGRLNYNSRIQRIDAALPMPRILLMLAVGRGEQLEGYTQTLNALFDGDSAFQGLRGPNDGQLRYVSQGETVVQMPFSFQYQYMSVSRPSAERYTQRTPGGTLTVREGAGTTTAKDGFYTAVLTDASASVVSLEFSWPAASLKGGLSLDLSRLAAARVEVTDSLLFAQTLPNDRNAPAVPGKDVQVLTLRDTRYLFLRREAPFADAPDQDPFTLRSLSLDGATLTAAVDVDTGKLQAGYYRLRVLADISGEQFAWPVVDWAENGTGWSVEVTNAQVSDWERFAAFFASYTKNLKNVPQAFQHAWGTADKNTYKGMLIPDFPPVYKAPFLQRLVEQLREAANVSTVPYVDCVFDVFVPNIR